MEMVEPRSIGESDGLTFWAARPEDYGAVMDISDDMYSGADYLPHRYHSWLIEPNRVVFCPRPPGLEMVEPRSIGESDGLTFWAARPEDYGAVMDISHDIYRGIDYLPHRYHSWLIEPNRAVVLAKRGEKLVALLSGFVVDEGHTVVGEGLRVCPTERGKGVARIIHTWGQEYIRQLYPSVRVFRLTRYPDGQESAKSTVLDTRAVLSMCVKAENLASFLSVLKAKLDPELTLTVLDEEHLRGLLQDSNPASQLQLPGDLMIIDSQPLQPIKSNLEVFRRRNLTWLADKSASPTFLSVHTPPYPIPYNGGSVRFSVDLFGTSPALARLALVSHLERVSGEIQGEVLILVYMHRSLWKGMREFCEGLTDAVNFGEYRGQQVVERPF